VNRHGQFNTPFGHHKRVRLADEENLLAVSVALQNAKLQCANYDDILLETARQGDFIYLDPPYLPVSVFSDFKRYTPTQFSEADHKRLAEVFRELDRRGCLLLLSNSFHPKTKKLYQGFRLKTVAAPRFINCKGGSRGEVKELLVMNY
jgi:DNA adenine methylase